MDVTNGLIAMPALEILREGDENVIEVLTVVSCVQETESVGNEAKENDIRHVRVAIVLDIYVINEEVFV